MTKSKLKVRNRHSAIRVPKKHHSPTLTEQHHAKACDINTIMAKYVKTGLVEHISRYQPQYGDVTATEFKESMDTVANVITEFEELPAFVRAHYRNPENYLHAISTKEGVEELRSLRPSGMQYDDEGVRETAQKPQKSPQEASQPIPAQTPDPAQNAQND